MIYAKFLFGNDRNELKEYIRYLKRCGYTRIRFRQDDRGFLI